MGHSSGADRSHGRRMSLLLLADDCNPEWPSLPIVGYKYALALGEIADVVVATHIRNRENIEKAAPKGVRFVYIDNERIAAPMFKLATKLRGGSEYAWSTNMIMQYLPYLYFEYKVWEAFKSDIKAGKFDVVHRITPMTPTLPSYIASKVTCPFVVGPLNGNLPWPKEFHVEQKREREHLRFLRDAAKHMPFSKATYRNAAIVLAGFEHTMREVRPLAEGRVVNFPEIGFDPTIFHATRKHAPFSGNGPYRFLYAGRLVPVKLSEVPIRAFAQDAELRKHHLHLVGDGPEMDRLKGIVAEEGLQDVVHFEGRRSQADLAGMMRDYDAFVFPSIRELGAGVLIEAMACGMTCIAADYGAPGHLAGNGRGITIPIAPLNDFVAAFRQAMRLCVENVERSQQLAQAGHSYAFDLYPWSKKAAETMNYYQMVLNGKPVRDLQKY